MSKSKRVVLDEPRHTTDNGPDCPKCGGKLERSEAKAPESEHVAVYDSCTRCEWFMVNRSPEHEAELAKK